MNLHSNGVWLKDVSMSNNEAAAGGGVLQAAGKLVLCGKTIANKNRVACWTVYRQHTFLHDEL